jgi:hypothetical protein
MKLSKPLDENLKPNFEKKKRKKDLWCPYCGDWQRFKQGVILPISKQPSVYKRCTGCTISTEDFHVKTANGLWEGSKRKGAQ